MANLLDFQRLSNFVSGIVDRKIHAVSMSITGSTGYLRGLVTQSQSYATESLTHANESLAAANDADTSAASTLIVWNEFTSTYVGLKTSDPNRSNLNNAINVGAFYIRQSDGRLRYATAIDGFGNPVWADATVTADLSSISTAGAGIFLSLNALSLQTVKGPITFQNTLIGPKVTSWTSQQLATATDVNDRVTLVQNAINTEATRATAAETALTNNKVNKVGDTMTGALTIQNTGEAPSLTVRNTGPSGRSWRIHSVDDGRLRIIDETASAERMYFQTNGNAVIPQGLTANTYLSSAALIANRSDGNDSAVNFQTAGVTRWVSGRSPSSSRYYIARFNASGVYIDSPLVILESDGSITMNRTTIVDTLSTRGSMRVDAVGASLWLNNSSGVADPGVAFMNLGYTRWFTGRSPSAGIYYINRYTDTGAYVDTPFRISEVNGWTTVNNLQSTGAIQASGNITCSILYAQANGTGRSVAIGDDVWIGDGNIGNGMTIRGQGDFNAGYVSFGNSGVVLGCNANDATLRYGGSPVVTQANISSFVPAPFSRGSNSNGKWRISSDGVLEQWGKVTIAPNGQSALSVTITLPQPYPNYDEASLQATARDGMRSNFKAISVTIRMVNNQQAVITIDSTNGSFGSNIDTVVMWRAIGDQ